MSHWDDMRRRTEEVRSWPNWRKGGVAYEQPGIVERSETMTAKPPDCGSNACECASDRGGMRVNGPCSCTALEKRIALAWWRDEFSQARAEARREAMDEAAKLCERWGCWECTEHVSRSDAPPPGRSVFNGRLSCAESCQCRCHMSAAAIRARAKETP